ncbi:unnamed protein product, partial [Ceratitis capitata]
NFVGAQLQLQVVAIFGINVRPNSSLEFCGALSITLGYVYCYYCDMHCGEQLLEPVTVNA